MSAPKRQKVIDEARLGQLCDDSETLFNLVIRYQQWCKENYGYGPFPHEQLKEDKVADFLKTSLNCPKDFAAIFLKIFINAMLDGKVYSGGGMYSFNLFFWGITDTWAHRNFPELNINGPVSEPLRKRLLVIHGKYKALIKGTNSYDQKYWKPVTEMYTLYWLTRPDWRKNFFRTWIRSSNQIDTFEFYPEPVIPLLKPTDNIAFYFWCLHKRCYPHQLGDHKDAIWKELKYLIPDPKQMEQAFCAVTSWYNLNERGPGVPTQMAVRQLLYDTNKAFVEGLEIPGFSHQVRAIQWKESIIWLCNYVALALQCDTPIWESLFSFMYYNQFNIPN